jgi:hypothetical protein
MLSWIPLLGPIIQGLTSIYTKFKDTQLGMRNADVEEAKASAQIIHDTADDIGIRIIRDMVCFPVAVWTMFIGWDTIVVHHHPEWVFIVEKYPPSASYLPYAVLMFLLGNIGINAWKRR